MNRPWRLLFFAFLALAVCALPAPAGPGDSEPFGPGPHAIVHAPSTILHTWVRCDVWVHSHHMPSGIEASNLTVNGQAATIMSYGSVNMGNGSWDERWRVNLVVLGLTGGETLTWQSDVTYWGNVYTGTAESSVQ